MKLARGLLTGWLVWLLSAYFFILLAHGETTQSVPLQNGKSNNIAIIDSHKIISRFSKELKLAQLILADFVELAEKQVARDVKAEDREKKLVALQKQIRNFYLIQVLRPIMLEINCLIEKHRYEIVVNSRTYSLEELMLSGVDSRIGSESVEAGEPEVASLSMPFSTGIYFCNRRPHDITSLVMVATEKYFKENQLLRYLPGTDIGKGGLK